MSSIDLLEEDLTSLHSPSRKEHHHCLRKGAVMALSLLNSY